MATNTLYSSPPAARAFPTPSTTPQRPPSIHVRADSSPGLSSSSNSLPILNFSPDGRSEYDDTAEEDNLSPLDPRRFTPTLHASLVSEILSLRRDVESKSKAIDILERSLDESRTENEDLSERLSKSTKETRSFKHQLQLLEGGASSALTELARERDEALENIADVRKKLEQAQKKARSREEDVERTVQLWDRDKDAWEGERRSLERKVHVVEGRLKVVLKEVVAAQAVGSFQPLQDVDGMEIELTRKSAAGKDSDSASVDSSSQGHRRTSVTSVNADSGDEADYHNVRYSMASVANVPGLKSEGLSLAQELAFDEEDEFESFDTDFVPESPEALPEERPASVHSQLSRTMSMGAKARKILGLSLGSADGYGFKTEGNSEPGSPLKISSTTFVYRDTGIQYSPPPSPLSPSKSEPPSCDQAAECPSSEEETSFYQRKDSSTSTLTPTLTIDMVSASCQTIEDLPTPPWTPKIDEIPQPAPEETAMVSVSVQTIQAPVAETDDKRVNASPTDMESSELEIPMIAIHPPCSEPPSPRGSVVLPPQTKSVSCQVNFSPSIDSRTVGIQTDEIRIDQRPVKLPASLLPSAIPDLPLRESTQDDPIQPYRIPPPRSRKRENRASSHTKPPEPVQAYPGNNDNGPLSEESKSELRRPLRSSSLFAGFDQASDEETSGQTKDIFTDDELLNRPFASYTLKRGKLVSTHDATLPEIDEHLRESEVHSSETPTDQGPKEVVGTSSWTQRLGFGAPGARQQDMCKSAMISNGAAAHQNMRTRSPSEPSMESGGGASGIAPPIPVPMRFSSRKFPSGNDGRQSPTPSNPRNFSDRARPPIIRRPTLRRVRSAAAMSHIEQHDRPDSRSSPTMSSSSCGPDSPQHPPLPFDKITAPSGKRAVERRTSAHPFAHGRHDSTATTVQPTSVVDAIAQTMVGEWMYKYIRRRRSFGGVGESKDSWEGRNADEVSANIANSGARHKRWVWLAPYERAVMWSSKQPTSGPALLGKSGRKLIIQSVLDVKDDNPLPKGFNPQNQFNRSILILTPQRALKFTASSIERHYVWLTALSFLSHSSMGLHDLDTLPPVPQEEYTNPAPTATLRRNPIRDSIRIAKGRPRPRPKGKRSLLGQPEPVPELPSGPPTVPRFSNHARKRSNTAPRVPIIRSFSSQGTMPSVASTRGSSDTYGPALYGQGLTSSVGSVSRRTSEASVGTSNFFDAIGTVRMEAFIDQTNGYKGTRSERHSRKASSAWSSNQELDSPYEEGGYFHRDDPFGEF
ncbi:nuclear migration protein [Aspergillus sclerotioniger CBS 115572]|uniref:Nuclear migration protein n=1 Tax=Aspergillus sclerotioniger CBS 115572 TaxID=1450535 RepID=A0A317X444_9EURO|nr:nuclear migration protein [Aspergillus sclerotioniger CBS 115572]PWY93336.1 nuclear migration protein [Aspergillus sclerotioniger CBS 115572]